jgi:hypothetical protein
MFRRYQHYANYEDGPDAGVDSPLAFSETSDNIDPKDRVIHRRGGRNRTARLPIRENRQGVVV